MSEAQFQNAIVAALRYAHFRVHFVPDKLYRKAFSSKADREEGRHSYAMDMGDPGFPDLTIVGCRHILYRELKVGTNTLSPDQEGWRDALVAAGQDWALWHDSQYDDLLEMIRSGHLCRSNQTHRAQRPVAVPGVVSPVRRYTRRIDRHGRTDQAEPELDSGREPVA